MNEASRLPARDKAQVISSPSHFAFPLLAGIFFALFFAASAPSPLFVVFQSRWGFSSGLLTVAFAAYAVTLMLMLVIAGSLSDHVGRRPVIIVALLLQSVAMSLFLTARGIDGLIAARTMQGVSMGIANGALSSAIVEAAPAARKRLGALVTSISPLAGLATGALVTGFSISFTKRPDVLIFGALTFLFLIAAVSVAVVPETTSRRPGAWNSLIPRVSVAKRAKTEFSRGLPLFFVVWALCGLYLSLSPTLQESVFGVRNGELNGISIATLCGTAALAPTLLNGIPTRMVKTCGILGLMAGLAVLMIAILHRTPWLFFLGTAIAGSGLGAAFSGLVQTLAPLADVHERAELFAAIYVASYLSLSFPPIVAGFLSVPLGLIVTVLVYFLILFAAAILGLWMRPAISLSSTT